MTAVRRTLPGARALAALLFAAPLAAQAPTARRTPISRVRSSTVASMMFMIPMPPTTREMAAMEPSTMLKIRLVSSA